jgi:hypothetical protein
MSRLIRLAFSLSILAGIAFSSFALFAQTPSTVIRVLDPSELQGIAGVILLINPGDNRKSQALITDATGEAIAHDLNCVICAITAIDPRGLFVSRTTEFSGSSPHLRFVLAIRPLIDIVGDPRASPINIAINNSKGQPLVEHDVVIRPTVMTLENNRISIQKTGSDGRVILLLRAGDYTVGAMNGDVIAETRFEVVASKDRCPSATVTCIVASPQSSRRMKPISLQLSSSNLNSPEHESGHVDPSKPQ